MDNKQARYLHQMLDRLAEGKSLSSEEIALLRKNLPELPKQKTLEEIAWDMDFAWAETVGNDWRDEMFGDLETWLSEQHNQLRAHLEGVKREAHPALPDGMRLAKHENRGLVVATGWIDSDNEHFCVYRSDKLGHGTYAFLPESSLTYIGSEPGHPEFLETEADYAAAPEGTVVACEDNPPWHKFGSEWSSVDFIEMKDNKGMTGVIREVLRWSWGNE